MFAAVNDAMYEYKLINTMNFIPFGLFIFIVFQSFMLSLIYSRNYKSIERLTRRLRKINEDLEEIVKIRTKKIEDQKEQIIQQRDDLDQLNQKLEKQRD